MTDRPHARPDAGRPGASSGHRRREFTHGHYPVEGRHLYVNRGLSYGQRVLEWCRPEITVFRLTHAEESAGLAGTGQPFPAASPADGSVPPSLTAV